MLPDKFQLDLESETNQLQAWFDSPRFEHTKRVYSASDVARLRPSIKTVTKSNHTSKQLWQILEKHAQKHTFSRTFGALDPVQVIQMAPHLDTVYVSGWQCSSTASTSNEPGPDFADYPYTTVPNKVDQLYRAQVFHDRKQREARSRLDPFERSKVANIDYYRPIIADGDTGFGGITSTMKLIQLFCEAGAAGVHLEDQKSGTKKCGHMAGKVMVSTREHIERLTSARLAADILGSELVLIARTDAEAATLLDSNIDPRDHAFILGVTVAPKNPHYNPYTSSLPNDQTQADWDKEHQLMTYPELVANRAQLSSDASLHLAKEWALAGLSLSQMRQDALEKFNLSATDLYFDWEAARTAEGFYRVRGGDLMCISRCISFSPYSDLVWAESSKPNSLQAEMIAKEVKERHPWVKLAYNCSPSFNWSVSGMSDKEIQDFQTRLASFGYIWQFITLAGFHSNGSSISNFARDYSERGMLAYVENIQRAETTAAPELQKHQKWSGAELMDAVVNTVTGGTANTTSLQTGNTETQFTAKL